MDRPRLGRRHLVALDVALAAGLVALSIYALSQPWDDGFRAHAGWLDVVAVSGMSAPFALRTLAPAWALGLVLVVNLATGLVGPHTLLFFTGFVPIAVLVYAVARHDDGWAGRLTWLCLPLLLLGDLSVPEVRAVSNVVFSGLLVLGAWAAGRLTRRFARRAEELEVAVARLQLEREAGQREAVELERSRIAGEMHDVVGHALSLMVLQTGAARTELGAGTGAGTDPALAVAERQLRAAEGAGRSALEELRRTLGVLRRGVPLRTEVDTSPH